MEEGGQAKAGDWTDADTARLRALVEHAHRLGFWSRFYTLDGFTALEDRGWDRGYNFGSREAVTERWKAAVAVGVDFISTDQYEDLAKTIGRSVSPPVAIASPPPGIRWIAHRGGVVDARYAENSPASLEAAVSHSYSMIEVDIRETKDGHIITQHDPDFTRFYDDPRKVSDLTLEQARKLRARPGGMPPMTFAELADASRGRLGLMMDVKVAGHSPAFLQEIERDLSRTGLLASAYFIDLAEARAYFKGKARVSATFQQLQEAVGQGEDVRKLYFLFEWGRALTEDQVRLAQRYGVPVVPTVNTFHYDNTGSDPIAAGTADIRRLRNLGVTEFQMDSVYESAFGTGASAASRGNN